MADHSTYFLFAHQMDDEGVFSLCLGSNGCVEESLLKRSWEDIHAIQVTSSARVVIVIPCTWCSLHEVEMPWLGEHKMRAALPFALEDEVAEPVSTLHVAFDRAYYQNGRMLVVAIEQARLSLLKQRLDEKKINYDVMTVDWFALNPNEVCIMQTAVLVNEEHFKGACGLEFCHAYLDTDVPKDLVLSFLDSPSIHYAGSLTQVDAVGSVWIAQRLQQKPRLFDLCQGSFKQVSKQHRTQHWYRLIGILLSGWFVTVLLLNWIQLSFLNGQIAQLDQDISTVYRFFFKDAHQVIHPRFRIGLLLKQYNKANEQPFWKLLKCLSDVYNIEVFQLRSIHYQHHHLMVNVSCLNELKLQAIKARLQQRNIQVQLRDIHVAADTHQVQALMEMSL